MRSAPVFLVGAPGAGEHTLLRALAHGSGVLHVAQPLTAPLPDAEALTAQLRTREDRPAGPQDGGTAVAAAAGIADAVPQLLERFPDARFVLVARAAEEAVPVLVAAGADPHEAAETWNTTTLRLLDDLDALAPDRWAVTDLAALRADPRKELRRLCVFLDVPYDQALLTPFEELRRSGAAAEVPVAVADALPATAPATARLAQLVAPAPAPVPAATPEAVLGSRSTPSFALRLRQLGSSLLISTYQTGKLICARERSGLLNTHFRSFDKPMGLAVAGDRLALGTRTEVWDLRDMPAVAPKLDPPGTHDACFLPRNRHVTGDIAVHDLAYAGGELWVVATAFSCLATLDADHSFVPRWTPPWISAIGPGDRCHLNGLAVVDDAVRYVTCLGTGDEPGSWRARKADGGVLVDVPSGEVVAGGLSMPHSPRWHDGRLWLLESGRGSLCVVDLDAGTVETVAELPGFTRGLAVAGGIAFVGLSQIRESSTFGDLPLTQRLEERLSGVWTVDLATGEVEGFLRFDDLVQEIFDVALLPGRRWPEIAEPDSTAVATSYVLP